MKLRAKRILLWMHYLLLVAGLSGLAYSVIVTIEARHYQTWAREQLQSSSSDPDALGKPSNPAEISRHAALHRGHDVAFVGKVDIPHIHLSAMIAEGASARVLDRAVGHLPGTALPGQVGNIALAAHRDTFFRDLKDIRPKDEIKLQTATAIFHYEVDWVKVVDPDDLSVLAPSTESALTLVTCYPFYLVGPAPRRFVVHAHQN